MRALSFAVLLFLGGCVSETRSFNKIGPPEFHSWVQKSLKKQDTSQRASEFRNAFYGNISSLKYFFNEAHAAAMGSQMNPANEMALTWELELLLSRFGDSAFANALQTEPSSVRSAVAHFIPLTSKASTFPLTFKVLQETPKIDFPLEQAYRLHDA